jgi:hypothetical protein
VVSFNASLEVVVNLGAEALAVQPLMFDPAVM